MFRLRFSVFSFLTLLPAALHLSLGSIISNKRTLYCFVSSICLLVCCCLWVVCACECRFGCFYVCVWVLQLVLRFLLLSPLSSCLHSLSRPNFRNRHRKGNVGSWDARRLPPRSLSLICVCFYFVFFFSVSTSRTYSSASLSPRFRFHFEHLGILELYALQRHTDFNSVDFFWFLAFTITTSFLVTRKMCNL